MSPSIAAGLISLCSTALPEPATSPAGMHLMLEQHNLYRAKHCVSPLVWSPALASSAKQWAERCIFDHQEDSDDGENLFWGAAGAFSQKQVVESWYEEIAVHSFSAPQVNDQTGHFTQVIWRVPSALAVRSRDAAEAIFWYVAIRRQVMTKAA